MPTIKVRNVDPAVLDKLKLRAQYNDRTIEAELLEVLREAVHRDAKEREREALWAVEREASSIVVDPFAAGLGGDR